MQKWENASPVTGFRESPCGLGMHDRFDEVCLLIRKALSARSLSWRDGQIGGVVGDSNDSRFEVAMGERWLNDPGIDV